MRWKTRFGGEGDNLNWRHTGTFLVLGNAVTRIMRKRLQSPQYVILAFTQVFEKEKAKIT